MTVSNTQKLLKLMLQFYSLVLTILLPEIVILFIDLLICLLIYLFIYL